MSLLLSTALQKLIRNMVINIGKSDSSMNNKVNSFHYQLVAINGKIVTFNTKQYTIELIGCTF